VIEKTEYFSFQRTTPLQHQIACQWFNQPLKIQNKPKWQ